MQSSIAAPARGVDKHVVALPPQRLRYTLRTGGVVRPDSEEAAWLFDLDLARAPLTAPAFWLAVAEAFPEVWIGPSCGAGMFSVSIIFNGVPRLSSVLKGLAWTRRTLTRFEGFLVRWLED